MVVADWASWRWNWSRSAVERLFQPHEDQVDGGKDGSPGLLRSPEPVQALSVPTPPAAAPEAPGAAVPVRPEDRHFAQLRSRVHWVETRLGRETLPTPDLHSRLLLAKSAAQRARLHEVGLGFEDVYASSMQRAPGFHAPAPARTAHPTWESPSSSPLPRPCLGCAIRMTWWKAFMRPPC